MEILQIDMNMMLDEFGEVDPKEIAEARTRMSENLRSCRRGSFYQQIPGEPISGIELYFTMLDFAIMADDVSLTAEMHERQMTELAPEFREEKLLSEDRHLLTAIFYESDAVVRWLLENGYDANEAIESGWTPIFGIKARTDSGLRITRDLVANGADLEHEGPYETTPLLDARRTGNLRKAQCLVSLGAQIPQQLPPIEASPYSLVDPENVEQVTAFLSDADRSIPGKIAGICSIDR